MGSKAKEVSADCNDSEVINAVSKMGDRLDSGGEAPEQQASPQDRLTQQKEKKKAKRAQADTVCIFRPPDPETVTSQIRDVLTSYMSKKKKPSEVVEEDTSLIDENGLDSLATVEVRSELQEYFCIKLSNMVLHNRDTIRKLAAHIIDRLITDKGSRS